MFYIKMFYKLAFRNFLSSFFFFSLATAFIFALGKKDYIGHKVMTFISGEKVNAYFFALISDPNHASLAYERTVQLPGVKSVETIVKDRIVEKTKKIISQLSSGIPHSIFHRNYTGLKVTFKEGVSERSKKLIQNYLEKLVGADHVTMGGIIEENQEREKKIETLSKFKDMVIYIFIGGALCLCLIPFSKMRTCILEEAYLIEKYQRRNNVAIKIYLAGVIPLLLAAMTFSIYLPSYRLGLGMALVTFVAMGPTFLKKYRWERA